MIDYEMLQAFEELLDRKLEEKLEKKLEEKLEEKLTPLRKDILMLYGETASIRRDISDIRDEMVVMNQNMLGIGQDVSSIKQEIGEMQDQILDNFAQIRETQTFVNMNSYAQIMAKNLECRSKL